MEHRVTVALQVLGQILGFAPVFQSLHVIIVRILADISCDESQEILRGENDYPRGNQDTLERYGYHYGVVRCQSQAI